MSRQEILDLNGVDVLAAHDDDVLLAIDQPVEAVIVELGHIAGKQPTVHKGVGCGLGVFVVAGHKSRSLDAQLTNLALRNLNTVLVDDLSLPAPAGNADGADVIDVLDAQMDTAGPEGFRQAVIGVVLMMRENLSPLCDEALGDRLRADMHQAPLVELVILNRELALLKSKKDILRPRNKQPHDGATLVAHRFEDGFRGDAAQKHRLRTAEQASHPVELGARVI